MRDRIDSAAQSAGHVFGYRFTQAISGRQAIAPKPVHLPLPTPPHPPGPPPRPTPPAPARRRRGKEARMSAPPSAPSTEPAGAKPSAPVEGGDKKKYPVNLPKTAFAMKANLVQNEPASLKR